MANGEAGLEGGKGYEREGVLGISVCRSTTSPLPGLWTATVLPRAEQAGTSQYSHFTFALFTLKKHQGFLSPSGFLKKQTNKVSRSQGLVNPLDFIKGPLGKRISSSCTLCPPHPGPPSIPFLQQVSKAWHTRVVIALGPSLNFWREISITRK